MHAHPPHPLLERTRELTPLIRQYRTWGEANYRMAPEVRAAVGAVGCFRLAVPASLGGLDAPLPIQVAVFEELAFADPSVSWIAQNSSAIGGISARLEETAARLLLTDVEAVYGFGLAPVGRAAARPGGYDVSGVWPVVSGCQEASWFLMASKLYDGDSPRTVEGVPQIRFAALPTTEGEVLDTWSDVVAVRGSGSNAVRVQGCFVPDAMMANLAAPPRVAYAGNLVGAGVYASLLMAATALGIARAAVEAVIGQAGERVSVVSGAAWREWPSVQDSVASVDIDVFSAREGLFALTDQIWSAVESGQMTPLSLRARAHAMADHAVRVAREGVSRLFATGSIDALHRGHGLEQALRDIHGFSVQWERYRRLHFEAGRVLLGAEPRDPLF